MGPYVGYVGTPGSIRTLDFKLTVQQIRSYRIIMLRISRHFILAATLRFDTMLSHQLSYTVYGTVETRVPETILVDLLLTASSKDRSD